MNKQIICVNVHSIKKILVLSTASTKGKPIASTLVET
jgi:hypothetical protein